MNRMKLAVLSVAAAALSAGISAQGQEFDVKAYCERIDGLPEDRRPLFGQTLCSNRDEIDANGSSIAENADAIDANGSSIAANAGAIMQQGMMIEENRAMIDSQGMSIANNMARLDGHDQMLANHADMIGTNAKTIKMVDERVSKVAAMAAALSAVPNAPTSEGGFFVGVGVGNHDGKSGVAIGLSGCLGRPDVIFNAGVANSSGETTLRAGIGWAF